MNDINKDLIEGVSQTVDLVKQLAEKDKHIAEMEETRLLQLVAISTISLCNTKESLLKQSLEADSPYWTVAFDDVKSAMEREIKLLEIISKARELISIFQRGFLPTSKTYDQVDEWLKKHGPKNE